FPGDKDATKLLSDATKAKNDAPKQPFFGRRWTDSDERQLCEAELVTVKNGKVQLKKRDGDLTEVPIEQFCAADLRYIATGLLLTESFSSCKEGDVPAWGRDAAVTRLGDGR